MKIIDTYVCVDDHDLRIIGHMMTHQEFKEKLQKMIDIESEKLINNIVDSYTSDEEEAG